MAMALAKVSTYTIMIVGRWKSTVFLDYIRKQVAEFSIDISDMMVTHGDFFTTPDFPVNRLPHTPTPNRQIGGGTVNRGIFHPIDVEALNGSCLP